METSSGTSKGYLLFTCGCCRGTYPPRETENSYSRGKKGERAALNDGKPEKEKILQTES